MVLRLGTSTILAPGSAAITRPRASTIHIMSHGDSITFGTGAGENLGYAQQMRSMLKARFGTGVDTTNRGILGHSWKYAWPPSGVAATLLVDAPAEIDAKVRPSFGDDEWCIFFAGTNGISLNGNSGTQEAADFDEYINARISAGISMAQTVVCAMLPRTDQNTQRAIYNAALVSKAATYGFQVCRLDLVSGLGADGDNNGVNYADGTHPNQAGHTLIAEAVLNLMYP